MIRRVSGDRPMIRAESPVARRNARSGTAQRGVRLRTLLAISIAAAPAAGAGASATANGESGPAARPEPAPACVHTQRVSDFGEHGLEHWEARSFSGETHYALVSAKGGSEDGAPARASVPGPGQPSDAGGTVLEAVAEGASSGLFRELDVDLGSTPVLRWSWSIEAPVAVDDVRTRAGDDFAARVYVVFSGGMAFWRTTSLVYVWADENAPEGFWKNPFTDNARMLAVNRGAADGGWASVRRDIVDDYRAAFEAEPPPVVAVAIMTDTDQTGVRAVARYGAIRFEEETLPGAIKNSAQPPCEHTNVSR